MPACNRSRAKGRSHAVLLQSIREAAVEVCRQFGQGCCPGRFVRFLSPERSVIGSTDPLPAVDRAIAVFTCSPLLFAELTQMPGAPTPSNNGSAHHCTAQGSPVSIYPCMQVPRTTGLNPDPPSELSGGAMRHSPRGQCFTHDHQSGKKKARCPVQKAHVAAGFSVTSCRLGSWVTSYDERDSVPWLSGRSNRRDPDGSHG